jgi:hypothetical protein
MNLKYFTDKALLADTKALAAKERESTLNVLHHIKEVGKRRLYSDLGYGSLFQYCVKGLK